MSVSGINNHSDYTSAVQAARATVEHFQRTVALYPDPDARTWRSTLAFPALLNRLVDLKIAYRLFYPDNHSEHQGQMYLWHCTYMVDRGSDSFLWQDWVWSTGQPDIHTIGHYFKHLFPHYTISREACEFVWILPTHELQAGLIQESEMLDNPAAPGSQTWTSN